MKRGKVYLVGAGPGDPGLISVKALECLGQADVVVYDRLLDESLLDFVPPQAERVYAGKSAGRHTLKQSQINQLLVEKAKAGKTVVRLKGGDPFVLGRGGEEAEALAEHGIPFEIIPGVSSAIAVPAYAGIPVTHRGLASSFAIITGHEDPAKASSGIAWAKLATGVDTLVFLMGAQNLPHIVAQLLSHGRAADTPAAVIKGGTTPEQMTVVGTLTNIVAKAREHHITPPAVIVVGEVVKLREKLRWFDNRPLFGKRVLITRARHQASALARLLYERGAQPIRLPTIEIQAANLAEIDRTMANLSRYQWLVFTSVNGVNAYFRRLSELKQDSRALSRLKIGAIGAATARALEKRGIVPDYVPDVYTSAGFIAGLGRWQIAGQRFLLLRADIADKELAEGTRQLGAEVEEVAVYRTVPARDISAWGKRALLSDEIDVIAFTSSSTVSNLVAVLGEEKSVLNQAKIACLGPKTAEAAAKAGLRVDIVAAEHTIPGLVAAMEKYFEKET